MDAGPHGRSRPVLRSFGPFTIDADRAELTRDGDPIALRPKTLALLLHLADCAGKVVSKQELLDAVWPGVIVTDDSLTQAVSELRAALGDREQTLIRTVSRRGYRLDAEVMPAPGAEARSRTSKGRRWATVGVGSLLVAVFALGFAGVDTLVALAPASRSAPPSIDAELADRRSLAVMPFTDLSDPKAPHVAYAVDAELTNDLGRLANMVVVSRESSAAFGTSDTVDPKRVGRELGVRHLLAGTVRQNGNSLSITVRLLRTDTGALLWSDRFDYSSVADWAAQRNILATVGNLLDVKVQQSVLERAQLSRPTSAAVDHWMRGAYLMNALETREQLALARGHFEAALDAEPGSIQALTGLARTHLVEVRRRWSTDYKESLSIAKTLARRALAVNSDDQTALLTLASALNFSGEMEDAMTTIRWLLQLSPNNAAANRELAICFYFLGRWEDALRQVDVAERLNPLDAANLSGLNDTASTALVALHRYDEAVERARRGAAASPSNLVPLLVLASAEAHRNNLDAARQYAAEILRRQPGYWVGRDHASRGSTAPAYLALRRHFDEGLKLAGLPDRPPSSTVPSMGTR